MRSVLNSNCRSRSAVINVRFKFSLALHSIQLWETCLAFLTDLFSNGRGHAHAMGRLGRVQLIVHENDHPHTDLTIVAKQGCTVDPPRPALGVTAGREPSYFGRYTAPAGECVPKLVPDPVRAAYTRQKRRLQDSRHTER